MQVVATAGHVDHGKSALVRALTGMEPDRWAEERRRGLTIDLGYVWLTLPSGERLAFVDVPGHERFVPNMLAGVGPVPAVMLVVAADGGWMPQSQEHLAAIDALDIRHGLLVVTRADLADPGPVLAAASRRIALTSLGQVEACAVSAVTGQGLPALVEALGRLASRLGTPDRRAPVRLWVDRAFSIRGSGTVVTGTLPAGAIRAGDELMVAPSGRKVRVRGLQSLKESVQEVSGVARVAVNLRGVEAGSLARGSALVTPGGWTLTTVIDVRIALPARPEPSGPGEPGGSGGLSWLPQSRPEIVVDDSTTTIAAAPPREVILHIGAARTTARVRRLGGAIARLTLRQPLPLHVGDRVLLRAPGAGRAPRTPGPGQAGGAGWPPIIGATVLDVMPPDFASRGAAAAAARELATWPTVPGAADLLRRHGLARAAALRAMGIRDHPAPVVGEWLADARHWAVLGERLAAVVAAHAAANPLAVGMPVDAARAALGLAERRLVEALVEPPLRADGGLLMAVGGPAGADVAQSSPHPGPAGGRWPDAAVAPGPVEAPSATGRRAAVDSAARGGPATAGPATAGPAATGPGSAGSPAVGGPAAVGPAGASLPAPVLAAVRTIRRELATAPFAAPEADRLGELGMDAKAIAAASRAGLLLRVSGQIVLAPGADLAAARVLAELPQPFTTAQARKALGTTRRVAIPLLEYLDRAGVTRRLPDDRRQLNQR